MTKFATSTLQVINLEVYDCLSSVEGHHLVGVLHLTPNDITESIGLTASQLYDLCAMIGIHTSYNEDDPTVDDFIEFRRFALLIGVCRSGALIYHREGEVSVRAIILSNEVHEKILDKVIGLMNFDDVAITSLKRNDDAISVEDQALEDSIDNIERTQS